MTKSSSARVIGMRELKAHASAVLREVYESGAEFTVSLHGRPIARIEPLAGETASPGLDGMGSSRGVFVNLPSLDWDDFAAAKRIWDSEPFDDQ